MALDYTYPTPLPSTKGWGPGYPNCQPDKIVPNAIFQGGVHRRIDELVRRLTKELKKKGYVFKDGWSWGYGCRGTKGGSGVTPSFHSWGLALDFNAPQNAMNFSDPDKAFAQSDIAQNNRWVVKLMHDYGFFWLGRVGDPMHFSFCGSPADADSMLKKAQVNHLGEPDPLYVVAGQTFKRLRAALRRVKELLSRGRDVEVKIK